VTRSNIEHILHIQGDIPPEPCSQYFHVFPIIVVITIILTTTLNTCVYKDNEDEFFVLYTRKNAGIELLNAKMNDKMPNTRKLISSPVKLDI
jgi:hypothetical protein